MKSDKKYKHPKVALCRHCGGTCFLTRLDERGENEITETCPDCRGSGRVVVSTVIDVVILPYIPEDKTKVSWKE